MCEQNCSEYFGTLEKIEDFSTVTENIIPGSLVFESLSPFMGYYEEIQEEKNPLYIYLVIHRTYAVFDIVRAYQKVQQELHFPIDAAKAFVKFNDRFYNAIRVRHIKGFEKIHEIQEAFARQGIKPLMTSDIQKKVSVHVSLKKIFRLIPASDNIIYDADEDYHAYFEIPKSLSFDEFAELTQRVKNNWLETKFDAALGYYMKKQKVVEIIRIYTEKMNLKMMEEIRSLYLQKIR